MPAGHPLPQELWTTLAGPRTVVRVRTIMLMGTTRSGDPDSISFRTMLGDSYSWPLDRFLMFTRICQILKDCFLGPQVGDMHIM